MDNVPSIPYPGNDTGTSPGTADFGQLVVNGAPVTRTVSFSELQAQQEVQAQQEIVQIAREPGNSALKMQLAQQGISLTDNSDVGAGERFDSFADKLSYVRDLKTKLLVAIMMSMVSGGGSPSGSDDIAEARDTLKTLRSQA